MFVYFDLKEILQTLGRKRLMEARKSSGPAVPKKVIEPKKGSPVPGVVTSGLIQSSSTYSNKDVVAVEVDTTTRKRIVEKLRSDVKGLRNAIRRSRRSNSRLVFNLSCEVQLYIETEVWCALCQ